MKNLVPVSHVVGAHAGGLTNLWDASLASRYLEMAAWLTPRNTRHLYYRAKFGHGIVKPYERNYGYPPEKFDPSRPAFQSHSRLLELTRINRLPMTSY